VRLSLAASFGCSIRHTASMVAVVAILETVETVGDLLDVLGKIAHLENAPDLDDVVFPGRTAPCPLDRFFGRTHVDHPVAAEHFLDLREGAVGDGRLAALERDACARRRRMQSVERKQHTGPLQLFIVFHHRRHGVGFGPDIRSRGRVAAGDHQHHETHLCLPSFCSLRSYDERRPAESTGDAKINLRCRAKGRGITPAPVSVVSGCLAA